MLRLSLSYFTLRLNSKIWLEKLLEVTIRECSRSSDDDHMCNARLSIVDTDNEAQKYTHLKPPAIPIFPSEAISFLPDYMQEYRDTQQMVKSYIGPVANEKVDELLGLQSSAKFPAEINQFANIRPSILKLTPVTQRQLKKILSTPSSRNLQGVDNLKRNTRRVFFKSNIRNTNSTENTMEKVTDLTATTTKIPILKITINKKYNGPCTQNTERKSQYVPNPIYHINNLNANSSHLDNKSNLTNHVKNSNLPSKPISLNLSPPMPEKPIKRRSTGVDQKTDICLPKTLYTRKGDLSRDNVRNQTSTERLRYLYTKAQRDCDILKIRLKALRERHKQEQEEIKKLQTHLGIFCKDITEESLSEISEDRPKRKKLCTASDAEDEDEYEKLLGEVRKIKQEMLNQRYPIVETKLKFQNTICESHKRNQEKKNFKKLIRNNNVLKVESTDGGEIVGEIYDDCDIVFEKINGTSNISFESYDNNSLCLKEEYLETVLIE